MSSFEGLIEDFPEAVGDVVISNGVINLCLTRSVSIARSSALKPEAG